ncbi:hypothetical protein OK016_03435 [Vibrio chagasii]|nr:hypothetical protein [Vibrio chagasii]
MVLGAMREVISNGTLFDGADHSYVVIGLLCYESNIQFDNSFLLRNHFHRAHLWCWFLDSVEKHHDHQAKSGNNRKPRKNLLLKAACPARDLTLNNKNLLSCSTARNRYNNTPTMTLIGA